MSNPSQNARSGCFSGISRLLLCKGSLQTHPSDLLLDHNFTSHQPLDHAHYKDKSSSTGTEAAKVRTPGVVARLMGLDSLPDATTNPKGVNRSTRPESVPRSRSVNFMDYLLEFDSSAQEQQHRRVKTSVSFREVPTLALNQETHDFLVLYLGKDINANNKSENSKMGSKSEVGYDEVQQKNEGKTRIKKNEKKQQKNTKISESKDLPPRRVSDKRTSSRRGKVSSGLGSPRRKQVDREPSGDILKGSKRSKKPINQKEELIESKFIKKMKNQKNIVIDSQSECSSEDSSPVSALSLNEFLIDNGILLPGDARSVDLSCGGFERKEISKKTNGLTEPDINTEFYEEVAKKVCWLTEEELKLSKWVVQNALEFEFCEEICTDFEQQILDLLIMQMVEEIMGFQQ